MPFPPRRTIDRARYLLGAGLLGGAAVTAAPLFLGSEAHAAVSGAVTAVSVDGRRVGPEESTDDAALRLARARLGAPIALVAGAERLDTTWEGLGARVDTARLSHRIAEARDPASPMRGRFDAQEPLKGVLPLALPVALDLRPAVAYLQRLKSTLDTHAADARVDAATGAVIPEREGLRVDVWATLERLERALRSGASTVEVAVEHTAARRTAADLASVRVDAVMGEFDTRYDASAEAAQRTHNLRVTAQKVDGTVLLPGEIFDFNAVVGERNHANGFVPAPVIAGGELVDGLGGGACQVAGTLHSAAFFAGLEIVERHPHSRPSSYIKLGLDAAVSYPSLNFRFRNDRTHPVVVRMTIEGGVARAAILGPRRDHMVSFVRRIDGWQAYEEREVEDPSLPAGVAVLSQRGVPGFTVRRWRILRDVTINQAIRQGSQDTYPPTTQIWRIGTGPVAPAGYTPPEGDTHPEYRADVYTVMTQGVGVEGTETVRREGVPGTPGWTERAGMPPARRGN